MKQKRNYLLLILVVVFIVLFNVSSAITIDSELFEGVDYQHRARLHSLFLEKDDDTWYAFASLIAYKNHLIISNWLVIWTYNSVTNSKMGSIWWWLWNSIDDADYAWIAGWTANTISRWDNSVIWWWSNNTIIWSDAVIAWWNNNDATTWGIIVWWQGNTAEWWIVLWWVGNTSRWWKNLIFWKGAGWWDGSFAWNGEARDYSAYIWARNWVLIWTYDAITWVNLVVNWAVKLGWNDSTGWVAWEIKVVWWCFYAYDWEYWHLINQSWTWGCEWFEAAQPCLFWNVQLQAWDRVSAYNAIISTECRAEEVVCKNWELVSVDDETDKSYKYAYCFAWEGDVKLDGGAVFEEITICNPSNSSECITIMDHNLWAVTNDITNPDSYGYYYQWWNNHWFSNNWSIATSSSQVNASWYGPWNYYESSTFIVRTSGSYSWDSTNNHNLWWWIWDTLSSNWAWSNEDRQWPCPSGYHVPSILEWKNIYNLWCNGNSSSCSSSNKWTLFGQYFKLPFAGNLDHSNTNHVQVGSAWSYWSSSIDLSYEEHNSRNLYFTSSSIAPQTNVRRSRWLPVRCFKN